MSNVSTMKLATAEEVKVEVSEGNILLPLEIIRDKYWKKERELREKAIGDKKEKIHAAADFYQNAATAVDRLMVMGNCRIEELA